tara:strand:- start:497 stop:982 length:486 start_codon:yes stop_codon:yes gene_type:complete
MRSLKIAIQQEDFSLEQECRELRAEHKDIGALVTFTGLVREMETSEDKNKLSSLFLEHYPGMTEKRLEDIAQEADQRWSLLDICIIHRIGALKPADQIVLVAVSSMHRQDAFNACAFIMDFLKTSAPFWKKTSTADSQYWVEARESDAKAVEDWAETSDKR